METQCTFSVMYIVGYTSAAFYTYHLMFIAVLIYWLLLYPHVSLNAPNFFLSVLYIQVSLPCLWTV